MTYEVHWWQDQAALGPSNILQLLTLWFVYGIYWRHWKILTPSLKVACLEMWIFLKDLKVHKRASVVSIKLYLSLSTKTKWNVFDENHLQHLLFPPQILRIHIGNSLINIRLNISWSGNHLENSLIYLVWSCCDSPNSKTYAISQRLCYGFCYERVPLNIVLNI